MVGVGVRDAKTQTSHFIPSGLDTTMSQLRKWLHDQRPRHQRYMSLALAAVEQSAASVRAANKSSELGATAIAAGQAHRGWQGILEAIASVVDCGCPRDMWPERVQEAIPSD